MKYTIKLLITIPLFFSILLGSCKKEELYAFKGTVLNKEKKPVVNANVVVFNSTEDWLSGKNAIAKMSTNILGEFKSSNSFNEGDYYIFIDKKDTTNWNVEEIKLSVYPKISLPSNESYQQVINHSNINVFVNTKWKLSNILKEYVKSGKENLQWVSIWAKTYPCNKDNTLSFGKDLSLYISEGSLICDNEKDITATYTPPTGTFVAVTCEHLLHTFQTVKRVGFDGWPQIKAKNGEMFITCDQTIGQLYVIYDETPTLKKLLVYSRI